MEKAWEELEHIMYDGGDVGLGALEHIMYDGGMLD